MINTLLQLTKGEHNGNIEEFTKYFYNGEQVNNSIDLLDCTRFYDKGSNAELLIYDSNKILYSCSYTEYYNQKIITHVYSNKGLVYKYDIDYDALENEFKSKKRKQTEV